MAISEKLLGKTWRSVGGVVVKVKRGPPKLLLSALRTLVLATIAFAWMAHVHPQHPGKTRRTTVSSSVCRGAMDADAIIFTLVSGHDAIEKHARRFEHLRLPGVEQLLFYGMGANLPIKVERTQNSTTAVRVPAPNAYPPRELEMETMVFLSDCITDRVQFLLRADLDAFISPRYIHSLYRIFNEPAYNRSNIGMAAYGRPHDKGNLGFPPGVPFCMGGPTIAYAGHTIRAMTRDKWQPCIDAPVSMQSDTEPQRCIFQVQNISCANPPPDVKLVQLYRRDERMRLSTTSILGVDQADSVLSAAHVVHPLKSDDAFEQVRRAEKYRLVPPVQAQHMLRHEHSSSDGQDSVCVLNKFAQRQVTSCNGNWNGDECSFVPGRCRPGPRLSITSQQLTVYVLSIDTPVRKAIYDAARSRLMMAGFSKIVRVLTSPEKVVEETKLLVAWVRTKLWIGFNDPDDAVLAKARQMQPPRMSSADPAYIPTPGEVGLRAAYKHALRRGIESGEEYFIIADDDLVPSKTLQQQMHETLTSGCGRYMTRYAAVLLLGATEWNERWILIGENSYGGCYDVHDRAFGSFAVLYNRHGAVLTLEALEDRPNIPTDHTFYQATLRGAFAAVASPNLFVVDHRNKTSAVDPNRDVGDLGEMLAMAKRSRWNLSNYAFDVAWDGA
jgi:hypothetical protein